VVELLLSKGALLESKDKFGQAALTWAAGRNQKEMVALLLEKGAYVDTRARNGFTPLMAAACLEHNDIFVFLLKKGAGFRISDCDEFIVSAAAKGREDLVSAEWREWLQRQVRRYGELNVERIERLQREILELAELRSRKVVAARLEKLKAKRPAQSPFKKKM
jgi:ankyrin repeat protein